MENSKKIPTSAIIAEYTSLRHDISDESINRLNEIIEEYDLNSSFFEENGKSGIKDCLGNTIVPAEFDNISACLNIAFRNTPVLVYNDGKWGVVATDGKGTMIVPAIYIGAHDITAPFFALKNNEGKWGLVDYNGHICIPFVQDHIYIDSNDGYVFFDRNGKMGVYKYDYEPTILTEPIFDEVIEACTGDVLKVENDGKEGFVTFDGKFISNEDYDNLSEEEQDEIVLLYAE